MDGEFRLRVGVRYRRSVVLHVETTWLEAERPERLLGRDTVDLSLGLATYGRVYGQLAAWCHGDTARSTGVDPAEWLTTAPDPEAIEDWSLQLAGPILGHLGDRPLDAIERIVVVAEDEIAERVPFELLRTRDGRSLADVAPLVREPPAVTGASGGDAPAGMFRAVAVASASTTALGRSLDVASFVDAVSGLARRADLSPPRAAAALRPTLELQSASDLAAALVGHPQVVIVAGYGQRDPGKSWELAPGRHLARDEAVSAIAAARPTAVVLALCHSGDAAGDNSPAFASALCAAGVPVVVGFTGEPQMSAVAALVRTLMDDVGARLRAGTHLELADWCEAFQRARTALADQARYQARLWTNPLAFRGSIGATPTPSRADTARARIWFTAGQLVAGVLANRGVRIPVPYTVPGAVVTVSRCDTGHVVAGTRLSRDQLGDIAATWPTVGTLTATGAVSRRASPHGGSVTGELSAALRALTVLTGEPVPPAALTLLRAAAATDWGSLDAVPRVLDINGSCVREFDAWPEVFLVSPGADTLTPRDPLTTIGVNVRPTAAELSARWPSVEQALGPGGSGEKLVAFCTGNWRATERLLDDVAADTAGLFAQLRLEQRPGTGIVALPGVASLTIRHGGEVAVGRPPDEPVPDHVLADDRVT